MDRCKLGLAVLLSLLLSLTKAAPFDSPVGYWKTLDAITGKPKSIIHIWKSKDDLLMGKVIKLFAKNGKSQLTICSECSGALRNQPVVGMLVVNGLKATAQQWDEGKMLDPENGRTYSCAMHLSENGKKLKVHGYIGLPLFGRSQTWERVDLMSG